MKNPTNKQCPLPVELRSPSHAKLENNGARGTVSLLAFAATQRDRKTHEFAMKYIESSKIFS